MKTAGELLKEARIKRQENIEDIAKNIKVKPEYLRDLESNNFKNLPSATFTKGFLRKYAKELGVSPDTAVAMFRRDFIEDDSGQIVPKGLIDPKANRPRNIPINLILITVAVLSFLGFFGLQLYNYFSLPDLEVLQPVQGETYTPKITVKGKTDPDNVVEINNQKVVISPEGTFSLDLTFTAGTHSVVVESINRQGKTRVVQRTFQVTK